MRSYQKIKDVIEGKEVKTFSGLGKSDPFYTSKGWRVLRKIKLNKNPICEHYMCRNIGSTIDHIIPIKIGGAKLDLNNLQTLCKFHNLSKTAKQKGQHRT